MGRTPPPVRHQLTLLTLLRTVIGAETETTNYCENAVKNSKIALVWHQTVLHISDHQLACCHLLHRSLPKSVFSITRRRVVQKSLVLGCTRQRTL